MPTPAEPEDALVERPRPVRARLGWTLCAIALAAVGLAQTSAGKSFLASLGVYSRPPSFTELYFVHPGSLPRVAEAAQRVTFAIHNEQHRRIAYSWIISTSRSVRVRRGDAVLGPGSRRTFTRQIRPMCSAGRVFITVALKPARTKIGFWEACRPHPVQGTHRVSRGGSGRSRGTQKVPRR